MIKKVFIVFVVLLVLTTIYSVVNKKISINKNMIATDLVGQTDSSKQETTGSDKDQVNPYEVGGIKLFIDESIDGYVFNTPDIQIKGRTVPLGEVSVNDQVTRADKEGNFMVNLTLDEGDNNLLIVANDDKGNYSEKEIKVSIESVE